MVCLPRVDAGTTIFFDSQGFLTTPRCMLAVPRPSWEWMRWNPLPGFILSSSWTPSKCLVRLNHWNLEQRCVQVNDPTHEEKPSTFFILRRYIRRPTRNLLPIPRKKNPLRWNYSDLFSSSGTCSENSGVILACSKGSSRQETSSSCPSDPWITYTLESCLQDGS